jgi:undecaprenyl-diphosphatase
MKGPMDYQLEHLINAPAGAHPLWDALMRGVANGSEPLFLGVVALWFLYGWLAGHPRDRRGALTALVAALGALAVVQVIDRLWERARPFVAHPGAVHLLVAHASDASFPSDHVTAACAIAAVLTAYHRRLGLLALLFAALLAYARVYIGVHYPGDVLGGALLGLAAGVLLAGPLAPLMDRLRALVDRLITALHLPLPQGHAEGV